MKEASGTGSVLSFLDSVERSNRLESGSTFRLLGLESGGKCETLSLVGAE